MKLTTIIKSVLKMIQSTGDQALYLLPKTSNTCAKRVVDFEDDMESDNEKPSGCSKPKGCRDLLVIYVDDIIETGDCDFLKEIHTNLDRKINLKEVTELPATFGGMQLERTESGGYIIHQMDYIKTIQKLPVNSIYEDFRSHRHKLAWLAASRPYIISASNLFIQVNLSFFNVDHFKSMNKVISYLHGTIDAKLHYEHWIWTRLELLSSRTDHMRPTRTAFLNWETWSF